MHLLRMMAKKEQMAVVFSWICIVLMCPKGSLKRSVRVLRVEVWIPFRSRRVNGTNYLEALSPLEASKREFSKVILGLLESPMFDKVGLPNCVGFGPRCCSRTLANFDASSTSPTCKSIDIRYWPKNTTYLRKR